MLHSTEAPEALYIIEQLTFFESSTKKEQSESVQENLQQTERLIFVFTLLLTFQECLSENPVLLAAHKTLKVIILI